MPPTSYRGCWHVVGRGLFPGYRPYSSPGKGVYDPRAFFPHAVSLGQAFAHCPRSLAAASRRSGGRVSVPLWLVVLSDQLPVVGLVGRYPTNNLMGRRTLHRRAEALSLRDLRPGDVCGISPSFPGLSPTVGQVPYVFLSRPPLLRGRSPTAARLACVRHTASVHPEPGSNSPKLYLFLCVWSLLGTFFPHFSC